MSFQWISEVLYVLFEKSRMASSAGWSAVTCCLIYPPLVRKVASSAYIVNCRPLRPLRSLQAFKRIFQSLDDHVEKDWRKHLALGYSDIACSFLASPPPNRDLVALITEEAFDKVEGMPLHSTVRCCLFCYLMRGRIEASFDVDRQ